MGLVELDYFDESKDGNLYVQLEPDVSIDGDMNTLNYDVYAYRKRNGEPVYLGSLKFELDGRSLADVHKQEVLDQIEKGLINFEIRDA